MGSFTPDLYPKEQPRKIYSVSEVNRIAKETLEGFSAWVHGEIAELRKIRTKLGGFFVEFNLKDETNQYTLPVIVWSNTLNNLGFEIENGLVIVVFGNLTIYERDGKYQFRAQIIELFGQGLLAKKFEELKKKLRAEGLFDEKYKKPIPKYPLKIGVITSLTVGAAWSDFKKHTVDKFPFFEIILADVFVQGDAAIGDIVWAIERLNKENLDIIVLTRGGGSFEDYLPFNSEEVARAIFASKIPIITAVGHERDETIADWVADVRCSTATAAAKLVTSSFEEFLLKEPQIASQLKSSATKFYQNKLYQLSLLSQKIKDSARNFVKGRQLFLENWEKSLRKLPLTIVEENQLKLKNIARELELLSPQRVLERGYSITYKLQETKIVKKSKELAKKDSVKVRFSEGEIKARVFEVN